MRKCAFTLAEVLITLGIIGVVAVITIPALITDTTERTNSERQANIAQKFTQAMNQMRGMDLLEEGFESTEAFVDELQKHLDIAKRCDSNHIADCWPTSTVIAGNGKEYDVSKAKKGKDLSLSSTTNNVGLILKDGGHVILNYNPDNEYFDDEKVTPYKKSLPVGNGKSKEFVYSSNVTSGIDFIMDVNGAKGPNKEPYDNKYYDIRSFTSAHFAGCDFKIGSMCVINLGGGYGNLCNSQNVEPWHCNRWLAAKQACSNINMSLASKTDLNTIYAQKGKVDGVPNTDFFWSSDSGYSSNQIWAIDFNTGKFNTYNYTATMSAMCVGSN